MKALFTHDHVFYTDEFNNAYSKGKYGKTLFDYYLGFFDEIKVISRFETTSELNGLEKITSPKITFSGMPNLSNFQGLISRKNFRSIMEYMQGYDFLVARLPSEIGLLSIKAARKLKIPYTIEFVACPFDAMWFYGNLTGKIYSTLFFLRHYRETIRSKSVFYVTNEFLQKRYPTRGKAYSVSDVEIDNSIKYHKLRKRIIDNKINIGLIGSLDSPHKGIDTAIKSIKTLLGKGHNVNLHILGAGSSKHWEKSVEHIASHVNFCGTLRPGPAVQKWLSKIDIYIQPSLQEGLPRGIIEAMNCGLPVIGSNAGGIPELVEPKLVHKKNDHEGLSIRLEGILNPKEYEASSNYSLTKSESFDLQKLLSIKSKYFAEVISESVLKK